jgi:Cytosol aminopeptidase family, N-terminal domain
MSPPVDFQEVACSPDQLEADIVAAFYFQDERPLTGVAALLDWRLNALVTRLLLKGELTGREGDDLLVLSNGKIKAEWILLLGAGSIGALNPQRWEELFRRMWRVLQNLGHQRVAFGFQPHAQKLDDEPAGIARQSWEGLPGQKPSCLVSFDRSWLRR